MDGLNEAAAMILQHVDLVKGGTQGAPKFPQPTTFQFLWQAHKRHDGPQFGQAVTLTLDNICQGGIYDHLGGGFARYSTDEVWLAPHFEKMLYDNALLIDLLTDVWQVTGTPLYRVRVQETIAWALREMRSSEDGPFAFASALDADSEGVEGKFYVWTEAEIDEGLGPDAPAFKEAYDVTPRGNWEGKTILNRSHDLRFGPDDAEEGLRDSRGKLLKIRDGRIRPQRDDKVLADWNGLMIAALAKAGAVFDEPAWIHTAEAVFDFITATMTSAGRLRHVWCAGRLNHPAVLDDYANMSRAALVLHGVTGKGDYLARAEAWTGIVNTHYWDGDAKGYFLGADDTDDIIQRSKTIHDNAVPSGNGVMADVLARLFYLTGEEAHRERAEQLFHAIAAKESRGFAHQPTLLNGFELLETGRQVVIVGEAEDTATAALRRVVFDGGLMNRIVVQLPADAALPKGHPAHGKGLVDGRPAVYVCAGPTCGLPVTDTKVLREELRRL